MLVAEWLKQAPQLTELVHREVDEHFLVSLRVKCDLDEAYHLSSQLFAPIDGFLGRFDLKHGHDIDWYNFADGDLQAFGLHLFNNLYFHCFHFFIVLVIKIELIIVVTTALATQCFAILSAFVFSIHF